MRLGPASGSTTGTPTPADVDAGPAHSALDDMLAMLDGVDAVVGGLDPLVSAQSAETADRLATQLGKARTNIGLIPAPLATTTDVAAIGKRLPVDHRGAHHRPVRGRQPARGDAHTR